MHTMYNNHTLSETNYALADVNYALADIDYAWADIDYALADGKYASFYRENAGLCGNSYQKEKFWRLG